jgi:hypothetical protein
MKQPLCSLAIAAMVSLSASALAAESAATHSNPEIRIAHAAVSGANDSLADPRTLDDYAGRYETRDGAVFFVDNDGGLLTIESAAASDSAPMRLRTLGAGHFVVAETGANVTFEMDADGRVRQLLLDAADGAVISAAKIELRGVVTIQDIAWRGVVTIHDVETVAPVTVAARLP